MNFDEIASILSKDPTNLYELSVCINPEELIQVDRMTYMFLLEGTIPKLLNIFIDSQNEDYGEIIVMVLSRYLLERFPSMETTMLNCVEDIIKAAIYQAQQKQFLVVDYLMQGIYKFYSNNPFAYNQLVTQRQGYELFQKLVLAAPEFSVDIEDDEYKNNLVPQQINYVYNSVLYYLYKFMQQYEDPQILQLQFSLLLNKGYKKQLDIENCDVLMNSQLKYAIFHNLIYSITNSTQFILKIMESSKLLIIMSKIQSIMKDQQLSFIIRLLLQETMNEKYTEELLIQLAKICVIDPNLLSFFEKQILEKSQFSQQVVEATTQLLSALLTSETLFDKNKRIMNVVFENSPQILLEYFGELISLHKYPIQAEKFLYQCFSLYFTPKFTFLLNNLQDQLLKALKNFYSNKDRFEEFKNWFKLFTILLTKIKQPSNNITEFYQLVINDITYNLSRPHSKSDIFDILYIVIKYLNHVPIEVIEENDIVIQLMRISKIHPLYNKMCMRLIIFRIFDVDYHYNSSKITIGSSNKYLQNEMLNSANIKLTSQKLCAQLLAYAAQHQSNFIIHLILQCIERSIQLDKSLSDNGDYELNEQLVSEIYKIWRAKMVLVVEDSNQMQYKQTKILDFEEKVKIQKERDVYKLSEQLVLYLTSRSNSFCHESELINFNKQSKYYIAPSKYMFILTKSIQSKIFQLQKGQFLSNIPNDLYKTDVEVVIPINQDGYTEKNGDQKIVLDFNQFSIDLTILFQQNGEIFKINDPMSLQTFICIYLEKEEKSYTCYFTLFSKQFIFIFAEDKSQLLHIQINISKSMVQLHGEAPFRNYQYFDDTSQKYKFILEREASFDVQFMCNSKASSIQILPLNLPNNCSYLLESSQFNFSSNCYYNNLTIKQNQILLFEFIRGQCYFYRILKFANKQDKINLLNLTIQKFQQLSENEFLSCVQDVFQNERTQTILNSPQSIQSQYGTVVAQIDANSKQQHMQFNSFILLYGDQKFNITEQRIQTNMFQRCNGIYNPAQFRQLQYLPQYFSLQQDCSINIIVNQIKVAKNIQFELLFIKSLLWSSESIYQHFITYNCIDKLVEILNNNLDQKTQDQMQIFLNVMATIGFNFVIDSNHQLSDVQISQKAYVEGFIKILNNQKWMNSENTIIILNIVQYITQSWKIFNYFERIQLFMFFTSHCIQDLIKNTQKAQILLQIIQIASQNLFQHYFGDQQLSPFMSIEYDEIYLLANTLNNLLYELIKNFDSENEKFIHEMFHILFSKFLFNIDQYQMQQSKTSKQLNNTQVKAYWFSNLISIDLIILLIEKSKITTNIQEYLNIASIIQSSSTFAKSLQPEKLLGKFNHLNYNMLENTFNTLKIKNDLFKIFSSLPTETQNELLPNICQLIVNRYEYNLSQLLELELINKFSSTIIENQTALYLVYQYYKCQSDVDFKRFIPRILFLIDSDNEQQTMSTVISYDIINYLLKDLSIDDDIYLVLQNSYDQETQLNQVIKIVADYIINQVDISFLDYNPFNLNNFKFISRILCMLNKNCSTLVNISAIQNVIYSSINQQYYGEQKTFDHLQCLISLLGNSKVTVQQNLIFGLVIAVQCCYNNDLRPQIKIKQNKNLLLLLQYVKQKHSQMCIADEFCEYLLIIMKNIIFSQISATLILQDQLNPAVLIDRQQLTGMLQSSVNFIFSDILRDAIMNLQLVEIAQLTSTQQLVYNQQYSQFLQCVSLILDSAVYTLFNNSICQCTGQNCTGCELQNYQHYQIRNNHNQLSKFKLAQQFYTAIQCTISHFKIRYSQFPIFLQNYDYFATMQGLLNFILTTKINSSQISKLLFSVIQIQSKNQSNIISQELQQIIDQVSLRQLKKYFEQDVQEAKQFFDSLESFQLYIKNNYDQLLEKCFNQDYNNKLQQFVLEIIHIWPHINKNILSINKPISDIVLQSLMQNFNKYLDNRDHFEINEHVTQLLLSNLNHELTSVYDPYTFILDTNNDIFSLITQKQKQDKQFYFCQSYQFNGEAGQKLPLMMKSIYPITLNVDQIITMFNKFKTLDAQMYYCMSLGVPCSRVAFAFIYENFIYVFEDSPDGKHFIQRKQSGAFKDFDFLVEEQLKEIKATNDKIKTTQQITTELYSEHFWEPRVSRINIDNILSIFERDYGGLQSAIDIHTNEGSTTSLVFQCYFELLNFEQTILNLKPKLMRFVMSSVRDQLQLFPISQLSDFKQLQNDTLMKQLDTNIQKYIYQLISNFKQDKISAYRFIYEINLLASRSYNDQSQYPIFPALFGQQGIDQNIEFRYLKYPIIFVGKQRIETLIQKCKDSLEFGSQQPISSIHFAHSQFSSWWQMRIEPFTTAHLILQNCKFDAPDRLFSNTFAQFKNALNNQQNCEEVIGELFYDPSFLLNVNCQDFGKTQQGEKVGNVKIPEIFTSVSHYVDVMGQFLESKEIKNNLMQWIQMVFSNQGYYIKLNDKNIVSVYPKISNFVQITKANADQALQMIMENASEDSQKSAIMKLIYFGKQPQPLFESSEIFTTQIDQLDEDSLLQFNRILNTILNQIPSEPCSTTDFIKQIPVQKYNLQFIPGDLQLAYSIIGITNLFAARLVKNPKHILKPCQLQGRLKTANVCSNQSADYKYVQNSQFNTITHPQYKNATSQNSLLLASKMYVIPLGMHYLQSPGQDYCFCVRNKMLQIYKLPFCTIYDEFYIGQVSCIEAGPSSFVQFDNTNEFFVGRKYGCVDLITYNTIKRTYIQLAYFPVGEEVVQLYYNNQWGVLAVQTPSKIILVVVPHMQKLIEIPIGDVVDLQFASRYPLIFIQERTKLRIVDFRLLKESAPIEEGFMACCYCDELDQLVLAKNFLIMKVSQVNKMHQSTKKWEIKLIGQVEAETEQVQVKKIWIVDTEVWMRVNDNQIQTFNLDRV